jgi:hypothetical protein
LPLAQRRELNFHHVQAEEKIAPEHALFHLPGEIAIGGGDDAEIGAPYCKRSKRPEFFPLEHPQQFRLQIECSPISSKNAVPPLAASISPVLLCAGR